MKGRKCTGSCRQTKPLSEFPLLKAGPNAGKPGKVCKRCRGASGPSKQRAPQPLVLEIEAAEGSTFLRHVEELVAAKFFAKLEKQMGL